MYRDLLQRLNPFFYVGLVLLAATLQSTIFGYFPLNYFQPDLMLICAVYLGFRRTPIEGGLIVILGSIVMEAHSGTAKSFLLFVYVYAFVAAQIFSKAVIFSEAAGITAVTVILAIVKRAVLLMLLNSQTHGGFWFKHFLIHLVPSIVIQILVTPLCLRWFKAIDMKTYRDDHADDEYNFSG